MPSRSHNVYGASSLSRINRSDKKAYEVTIGMESSVRVGVVRPDRARLGSDYGGWEILPGLLSNGSVVYSFGVGEDKSSDLALIERFGLTVQAFDPTPRSIAWVKDRDVPEAFVLHEFGLADFDGLAQLAPPEDLAHVSHRMLVGGAPASGLRFPVKKLDTILRMLKHDRIDLLKLDIEGAEYSVIEDLVSAGIRPTQLLVEFHHRFSSVGTKRTKAAIQSLRRTGYRLFSVSSANEEFSFVFGGNDIGIG